MNKLEERFEEILDCNIDYKQLPTGEDIWDYTDVFKNQAKEARQFAINCCITYKLKIRTYGADKCPGTIEDVVDDFIKQYYV